MGMPNIFKQIQPLRAYFLLFIKIFLRFCLNLLLCISATVQRWWDMSDLIFVFLLVSGHSTVVILPFSKSIVIPSLRIILSSGMECAHYSRQA